MYNNKTGIQEHKDYVENMSCKHFLHFSSVLKCPECFITVKYRLRLLCLLYDIEIM